MHNAPEDDDAPTVGGSWDGDPAVMMKGCQMMAEQATKTEKGLKKKQHWRADSR